MVTFLTSDPLYEDGEVSILNEANGFVEVLRQYWDGPLKCLFIVLNNKSPICPNIL